MPHPQRDPEKSRFSENHDGADGTDLGEAAL